MEITYDPNKDQANQEKHGVSLADAAQLDWGSALIWPDERKDYNEVRMIALALIGNRVYSVAYVDRGETRRIISLRKANHREVMKYVDQQA